MHASIQAVVNIDYFIRFAPVWEILVGIALRSGRFPRIALLMTFATMMTTLSIPWMAPELVWALFPVQLTFKGECVVKDIVIAGSALALATPSALFRW